MGAVCCCCRPPPPPEDPSPPTSFIDPEETPSPPEDLGTPEERERAFNTVLDTEKNKILIREHIVKLARRTLACRAAFENVSKLLASFDNQNFSTMDGRAIPELRPGWDELRKRYDTLLLVSRSEAVVVKAVCDGIRSGALDYIETVLKPLNDPSMSIDDKVREVESFIERTKKSQEGAQSSAEDFDNLRQEIESYHGAIELALANANARDSISELRKSIRSLKVQIVKTRLSLCKQVAGDINKTIVTSVATSNILLALCPELAVAIADQLGLQLQKSNRLGRLKSELREKEGTFSQLRRQEKELGKFTSDFKVSEDALQDAITHVTALSNFWESVRADCQGATIHLGNVHTGQTTEYGTKKLLGTKLAGSVYLMLSKTLGTYAAELRSLDS